MRIMRKGGLNWLITLLLPVISQAQWHTEWGSSGIVNLQHNEYRHSMMNPGGLTHAWLGLQSEKVEWWQTATFKARRGNLSAEASLRSELTRSDKTESRLQLSRAVFAASLGNMVVSAGRQVLRWGTAYWQNPSDFVAPDKRLTDPEDREGRVLGRDMLVMEYFAESFSITAVGLLPQGDTGQQRWDQRALALRLYSLLGDLDCSLMALFSHDNMPVWGGNAALVLGDRLELHGEFRLSRATALQSPDPEQALKLLGGFQLTLPGGFFMIAEACYSSQGLVSSEWNAYADELNRKGEQYRQNATELNAVAYMSCLGRLNSGENARWYGFCHLQLPAVKRWQIQCSAVGNFQDGSLVLVPQLERGGGNHFTFYGRGLIFLGSETSEYGGHFQSFRAEGGVRFLL